MTKKKLEEVWSEETRDWIFTILYIIAVTLAYGFYYLTGHRVLFYLGSILLIMMIFCLLRLSKSFCKNKTAGFPELKASIEFRMKGSDKIFGNLEIKNISQPAGISVETNPEAITKEIKRVATKWLIDNTEIVIIRQEIIE